MGWEPIEVSEALVRDFAESAARFCESLNDAERRMLHEVIARAGGDGGEPDTAASEPSAGRYGNLDQPENRDGSRGTGGNPSLCDDLSRKLAGVWEPGTTIAPIYSGDMPREGGGTLD
ncbi:MAG TPA: hypothetical protein VIO16_03275 [Dehalococcoidia bacterium]